MANAETVELMRATEEEEAAHISARIAECKKVMKKEKESVIPNQQPYIESTNPAVEDSPEEDIYDDLLRYRKLEKANRRRRWLFLPRGNRPETRVIQAVDSITTPVIKNTMQIKDTPKVAQKDVAAVKKRAGVLRAIERFNSKTGSVQLEVTVIGAFQIIDTRISMLAKVKIVVTHKAWILKRFSQETSLFQPRFGGQERHCTYG